MFKEQNTYWNNNGKHQAIADQLNKLIPDSGKCTENAPKLETFRQAANCYYDYYNNALCNRSTEFEKTFGFVPDGLLYYFDMDEGKRVLDGFDRERFFGPENMEKLEYKINQIILDAAQEQNIPVNKAITVLVTYSNGDKLTTSINATLEKAITYFMSFDRITEDFETGKESAAKCISVSLLS